MLTRGLSPCACKDILKGKQGKLKGTNIYFNVARELINSNPKMKKIFEYKIKCSQRVCPPVSAHHSGCIWSHNLVQMVSTPFEAT